jgi:surface antigen
MSIPVRIIALVAAVLVGVVAWLPVQAQYLGLGIETNIELTKQDLDIIRSTVTGKVHGKPVGTSAHWSNPQSGNYGKIVLLRKFERRGQQCETVEYAIGTNRRPVRPEHYRLNSCLQPDGQWRII